MADRAGAEKQLSIFSAEGRIWQSEYALKVVRQSAILAVGVKTEDGVAICVEKKTNDPLLDRSTVTHVFDLTGSVCAVLLGFSPDVQYLALRLRYEAAEFRNKNGFDAPVEILASRVQDLYQFQSQYAIIRPSAVSVFLASSKSLWKVEPVGAGASYRAAAIGGRDVDAEQILEKQPSPTTLQDAAVLAAATVLALPSKATAIPVEFEVVSVQNHRVRVWEAAEIEELLRAARTINLQQQPQ